MDPTRLGLVELAAHIRRGALSATECARALLDRVHDHQHLGAFITLDPDRLLRQAKRADEVLARHGALGSLHGVPVAVKDNIDTSCLPTTGGTPSLHGHRPDADAAVVLALRQAGALVMGKTNLDELAYGVTGDNAVFGTTRNPFDHNRIAGGSSGGSAVAVSARLAPAALGTDTGGSVRIPAALCGVTALRPTQGRYPQHGVMTVSSTRDTVGPLAATVADVALLDAALAGATRAPLAPADLAGLRMGVLSRPFFAGLAPDLAQVVDARLAELARQGVELVGIDLPQHIAQSIITAGFPIAFYETPITVQAYLAQTAQAPSLADVVERCGSPGIRRTLTGLLGEDKVPIADYLHAMTVQRPALQRTYRELFATHRLDALVYPTVPLTAAAIGVDEVELGGQMISAFLAYTRNTGPGSCIGWPGLTLPAGVDDAGLPVGLSLETTPGRDQTLLRIGHACELLFGPLPPSG
ncbi:indoleacetamide hydrolase [Kibdelosporangium aridum]|uniref:indoleacetamide hydrolase n=1 Tax=Kibdelosporangium aridum TaxID=2030 RepID=UPI000560BDF1|nr:indoleacetamide hydrolase [Kibdelosporangium aridum]